MKNSLLLLKTLLLSTAQWNIYRHSTDKKKRRKIALGFIGRVLLYAMIMLYCIFMCIGYGHYGLSDAVPVLCALSASVIAFVFTLFRTNGYLFAFKEYDMLLSLPFKAGTVAGCKFLYMYLKALPWYISISLAMLIGYGYYAKPPAASFPIWLLLSLVLPLIPMLLAAFIGFLIARISSRFQKTNIVQTVLTVVFVLTIFSLRFVLESIFRNHRVESTLRSAAAMTQSASRYYLPAAWFSNAVTKLSAADILLLLGVSIALFAAVFLLVGRSYRNINSALKSHAAAKHRLLTFQKRSALTTIAFKEFKRMTGSTTYMVNGAMGEILAALLGIVTLIFGFHKIVATVTANAPFDPAILQPAIPFIIYFFIGMVATTVFSPSLEGKNYWIMQSLPIEKKTVYQGKMLFNMVLTVPFMLFATLCLCISARVPVVNTALYVLLGMILCTFSTAWGCVCGMRHMRLDWENEVEVIKQGGAVAIYMLPHLFAVLGLCALTVFLGTRLDHRLIVLMCILITGALAALSYRRVMKLCKL